MADRTIELEFADYMKALGVERWTMVANPKVRDELIAQIRKHFYAGAIAMFNLTMVKAATHPEPPLDESMKVILDELEAFRNSLKEKTKR